MPILVRNVSLSLDESEDRLPEAVARRLGVTVGAIRAYAIARRSLDARKTGRGGTAKDIHFSYHVEVALDESLSRQRSRLRRLRPQEAAWIEPEVRRATRLGVHPLPQRPIVVGFGPGGMFAALRLAEWGYRPIVLERGREVRRRHRDIMQRFYREHDFDPSSNLLFGEGGAGTYSDGKLYTRIGDPLCRDVLETLYRHGADPDILIDARPHVGSDRLPTICTNIRRKIESLGGEVRFESLVDDIRVQAGRLTGLRIGVAWIEAGPTILAVGHSARDTIRMLAGRAVRIEPKPFQVGVRIEHPQSLVDRWLYGQAAGHERLSPAEYHLVAKGTAGPHGDVFSFCMCPGGVILPTNESAGLIATNGASRSQRSGRFANSGLVITVDPAALGLDAMDGLVFQERWERLAFEATGGTYRVPAQRAADFLCGRRSDGQLETSYPLGGQWTEIRGLIPESLAASLDRALPMLAERYPGFAGEDAIITAPETRASAPIRIVRDAGTRCAVGIGDLYPVGEGAGYAGGIVSAAVDGLKSAEAVMARYAPG